MTLLLSDLDSRVGLPPVVERLLLDVVADGLHRVQHPDAPTGVYPAPRSLQVPRHEQRPMTIRLPSASRAGVRAARLA